MSFGDIDTLNLLFDKLQNLLNDTQGYYESFLDANTMYKQGKLTDKEFFEKLGDYVVSYSSLEFLSVKVIFELKKSLDKISRGRTSGSTMVSPMTPDMGQQVTASTLSGLGQPPSIISAAAAFSTPGVLPPPDPALMPKQSSLGGPTCNSCGSAVKANAKFCPKCGNKI
ncbi:MAG: zinc ribbon domain-containing protein [Nitrosopumilales archaeon]|nr:MAG: zinc ribbon domain-containing protein [Nitrosopumilales archaeon]